MTDCSHCVWTIVGLTFIHCLVIIAASSQEEASVDGTGNDIPNAHVDVKRHIGRWKNANWVRENRGIGRWRNSDWEMGRSRRTYEGEGDGNGIESLIKRSYPEIDLQPETLESLEESYPDLEQLYGEVAAYPGDMEKRLNSRWALIHRKLNQLNSKSKSSKRDMDADKRHASRWKLVHRKLQQLQNASKNSA